jgi:tetratricopeptide (TPR) repeat protein
MTNKKKNKLPKTIRANKNRLIVYILFLILVPSVLYFRVVNFNFSNFDDANIIVANYDTISNINNVKEAFTHDAFMSNAGEEFYRPVQTISFMLDAQAGGKLPWMYHLSNLLIHILTVIALFFFLIKIGIKKEISFLLSLFFSIHPLFTHAVAWIPARGDLLLGLFSLLSFITFLEYFESKKIIYFILHAFVFLAALLSKETALLLPVLILLYVYFAAKNKFILKNIIPFLAVWCFSFILFYYLRQNVVRVKHTPDMFGVIPFIKNLPVIPITFGKFFVPNNLATLPLYDTSSLIIGIILLIIFASVTIKFINGGWRMIIWGSIWFLSFTIPPMLVRSGVADIGFEYFEYRAYLPMIGILVIMGILSRKLPDRISFNTILELFIPVILIYAVIAFIYSTVFKDPISFFTSAINANSKNAMAFNSRGCEYSDAGMMDQAKGDFDNAISICPTYSNPFYNKADVYKTLGDDSRAEELYSQALKYDTLYSNMNILHDDAYISLSAEKIIHEKFDEALVILSKAKSIYPLSYKLFNNAGYVYSKIGKYDSALYNFNRAIELEPNTASYYNNRAKAKYHLKDFNGALIDFQKALELDPELNDAYLNRGITKLDMNDYEGAISDFNMAISLDVRSGEAYYQRGAAYLKLNRIMEAKGDWGKASELGYRKAKEMLDRYKQ